MARKYEEQRKHVKRQQSLQQPTYENQPENSTQSWSDRDSYNMRNIM
jgi:hypothetical protein